MPTNPKLILWDLDGVLCPHNERFFKLAPFAVAQAAVLLGAPLTKPEAQAFARTHFSGQRACVKAFAKKYQLNEEQLFAEYYLQLSAEFLEPSQLLNETLAALSSRFSFGVLTQASESWALRALGQLQLLPYFKRSFIWGREHLTGFHKADPECVAVLLAAYAQHGISPAQVALVDDKRAVLEALQPCASTRIWVSAQSLPQTQDGVYSTPDALSAIRFIARLAEHQAPADNATSANAVPLTKS